MTGGTMLKSAPEFNQLGVWFVRLMCGLMYHLQPGRPEAVVALISLLLCILKESSAMMEKKGSTVQQIVPAAGLALVWAACAKPIGFVEGASGWAPNKLPGQRSASSLRGLRSQAPESGATQGTRPGLVLGFSGLGLAAVARAGALRSRHRSAKVSRRFFGNLFGPEEEVDPEDPGRVAVCSLG